MTTTRISITGLDEANNELVNALIATLVAKSARNGLRQIYYDNKHLPDLWGDVVPALYRQIGLVLGWSGKAVDLLARRCTLEGISLPGADADDLGITNLWHQNRMTSEVNQAIISSLLHATTFAIAHKAVDDSEPPAMIHFRSAMDATGVWDERARRLTSLLTITDRNEKCEVVGFTVYLDGETIDIAGEGTRWSVTDRREHGGTVPAEVLPYRPRLGRPFGCSRLSRPMMALQDAAVRELIRTEGHMDVFSWPEMWMLGADESIFKNPDGTPANRWQVMLGRIKGIPDDDEAANPRAEVRQFPAASPEPHLASLNAFAKLFAREASLPDTAMAITDVSNPTSAESYDASQYELIAEAEGATDDWTPGLTRIFARALAIAHGEDMPPAEWSGFTAQWRDPRYQSRAAQADAGMKTLTVVPWLAETKIGLGLLGLSPTEIELALGERRKLTQSSGAALLAEALNRQTSTTPST